MKLISALDREFFWQNGVVCLRNFLEPKWIELLQRGFTHNLKNPGPHACFYTGPHAPGMFRDDYCNWSQINEYKEVIFNSPLAQAAGFLLQSREVRFFHEHIFLKLKGTIKKTPWHQDLPYYCVDGDQGVSFWIPLTDIDESNKIEFIAGSHKLGKLFTPQKFNGIDTYELPLGLYHPLPNIDDTNHFTKLSWTMKIKDVIAFDFRTIHGNTENEKPSLFDRRSIALRFLGESMRYTARPGEKSPPFTEVSLSPGAPLNHALFPLVWQDLASRTM